MLIGFQWCMSRFSELQLSANDDVVDQLRTAWHFVLPGVRFGFGSQSDGSDVDGATGRFAAGIEHSDIAHWYVTARPAQSVRLSCQKCSLTARPISRLWYVPATYIFY